jgi:hypothetical protein
MKGMYELRLYDQTLMTFSLKEQGVMGLIAEIISVDE